MSIQIEIPTSDDDYVRTFDASNPMWMNDSVFHNHFFLKAQQNFFNQCLQVRGFLILNDVLVALGFNPTPIGSVVGWVMPGDGVSFGIFDSDKMLTEQDTVGVKEIHLKFNVEGVVINTI